MEIAPKLNPEKAKKVNTKPRGQEFLQMYLLLQVWRPPRKLAATCILVTPTFCTKVEKTFPTKALPLPNTTDAKLGLSV